MKSTEDLIGAYLHKFRAKRGSKMIHAGGRAMHVHTAGERVLWLPNGAKVKVTTDDSGTATHIEENDGLHAIARPDTVRLKLNLRGEPR